MCGVCAVCVVGVVCWMCVCGFWCVCGVLCLLDVCCMCGMCVLCHVLCGTVGGVCVVCVMWSSKAQSKIEYSIFSEYVLTQLGFFSIAYFFHGHSIFKQYFRHSAIMRTTLVRI